jgi:hypothetical protein
MNCELNSLIIFIFLSILLHCQKYAKASSPKVALNSFLSLAGEAPPKAGFLPSRGTAGLQLSQRILNVLCFKAREEKIGLLTLLRPMLELINLFYINGRLIRRKF